MSRSHCFRRLSGQIWAGAIALLLLAACGGPNPVTTPTPTPLPPFQYTTIDLKLPPAALNAPVVGSVPPDTILHVSVTFKTNQQVLNQLNQKRVSAGQTQNVQDLANKLGISDQTYQKIKSFFGVENATLKLNSLHTNLTVDAKASTFARLFQTRFVIHQLNGRTFFTPAADAPPKLPTFIAGQVLAISGLDNYSVAPHKTALERSRNAGGLKASAANCSPIPGSLTPALISRLYGYDQFYKANYLGQGMTVNLVEFDGLSTGDVQNYLSCVRYQGKITTVTVGSAPAAGSEATGDVEMVAGLAPAANMVLYQTDLSKAQTFDDVWTLFNDELQQLINDNSKNTGSGSVVSISLGVTEGLITNQNVAAIDQDLQILTKVEHMTVFVASSDCAAFDIGSEGGNYGVLSVSFPASDPYAVAVGGTIPAVDSHNNLYQAVWSDGSNRKACKNSWGSGGGLSQVFQRQSWQQGPGVQNKYTSGARQMPDIAAFADDIAIYFNSAWVAGGGTSFATPMWAAGMALVNQALIQQTKSFYFGPNLFYGVAQISESNGQHPYLDVTAGNNLYYPATTGWDYATGFGTPNLPVFYNILLQAAKNPNG